MTVFLHPLYSPDPASYAFFIFSETQVAVESTDCNDISTIQEELQTKPADFQRVLSKDFNSGTVTGLAVPSCKGLL